MHKSKITVLIQRCYKASEATSPTVFFSLVAFLADLLDSSFIFFVWKIKFTFPLLILMIAQVLKEKWFKSDGFCSFTNNKQTFKWSCQRARVRGQDRRKPPALGTYQIAGFGGFRPLSKLGKKISNTNEFGFRRIWRIKQIEEGVIHRGLTLIALSFIQNNS